MEKKKEVKIVNEDKKTQIRNFKNNRVKIEVKDPEPDPEVQDSILKMYCSVCYFEKDQDHRCLLCGSHKSVIDIY